MTENNEFGPRPGHLESSPVEENQADRKPLSEGWTRPGVSAGTASTRILSQKHASWTLRVAGAASLCAALVLGVFYFIDGQKEFPLLEPGSYVGTIEALFPDSPKTHFYIERAHDREELFVAVLRRGWKPQLLSTLLRVSGEASPRWILPLIVSGGTERLRFIGQANPDGQYSGLVEELVTGREAPWTLSAVRASPQDVVGEASEVRLWLMLVTELEEVEARIKGAEQRVPEQRAEIEKLTTLLTEGEMLRSRANEKFDSVRDELVKVNQEYEKAREETRKLEASLEVSLKVIPQGKLVSLSRESLEREWRVVDSLLRTELPGSEDSLQVEFERAERVKKLQDEIIETKAQIEALEAKSDAAQRGDDSSRARYNHKSKRGSRGAAQ